uniref:Sperm-associated antigen 16 protein n=1 Tax=Labrus bergylta TaxID=56723 RepID=A0A3Q3FNP8_9LABR
MPCFMFKVACSHFRRGESRMILLSRYEEVCLEDERSFIEGEEDLEATVKAIKEASAAASGANTTSAAEVTPEAVDDFLRCFLFQMGMIETLDCYQAEWTELVQKGLLDTGRVGAVPEVYTENRRLERALKNAQREREEYREAGSSAAETLQGVRKERDLHRLQHKRVVQEKSRLIGEMKKLKGQCNDYEPEVKRMNEKYKAVLKQTMQVSLEREKLRSAQHDTPNCGLKPGHANVSSRIGKCCLSAER